MRRTVLLLLCAIAALLLGLTSCRKIDDLSAGAKGPLVVDLHAGGDAIPLGYGELVGVTPDPRTPWQAILWFEDPNQTVTAVWVNTAQRRVVASLKIPRG